MAKKMNHRGPQRLTEICKRSGWLFPLDCGDKAIGRGNALAVPIPFRIRAIREIRSSAVPAVPFPIQSGVALRLPPHSIYRQGEIDVFEMKLSSLEYWILNLNIEH